MPLQNNRKPILRLKTGCFTCRRRKKKCDEVKPICKGCQRNKLECSWPDLIVNPQKKWSEPSQENSFSKSHSVQPKPLTFTFQQSIIDFSDTPSSNSASTSTGPNASLLESPPVETFSIRDAANSLLDLVVQGRRDLVLPFRRDFTEVDEWNRMRSRAAILATVDNIGQSILDEHGHTHNIDTDISSYFGPSLELQLDQPSGHVIGDPDGDDSLSQIMGMNSPVELVNMPDYSSIESPRLTLPRTIPDLLGTRNEIELFFLKNSIVYLQRKLLHPHGLKQLQLGNFTTPLSGINEPMKDLMVAYGAHYLSMHGSETIMYADRYYTSSLQGLRRLISESQLDYSEDWLIIVIQLLGCFERLRYNNVSRSVGHLAFGWRILKERLRKARGPEMSNFSRSVTRVMTESVLYNAAVVVYFCPQDRLYLAPPAEVFDIYIDSVRDPLYPTEVPWANNPLTGAGVEIFKLVAKVSWIVRKPQQTAKTMSEALRLSEEIMAINFVDDVPLELPEVIAERLRQRDITPYEAHLHYLETFRQASLLLIYKAMDPDLQTDDEAVMACFETGLRHSMYLSGDNVDIASTMIWSLYILGCSAHTDEDKLIYSEVILQLSSDFHTENYSSVALALKKVWDRNMGLDALLDRSIIETVAA
ncbi:hypothetical protein CANCADRAFT_72 [Tortispora caseinolytica NRRL Y-17796]|uniref:Zn(2)-C6 fungal-type domain-containing protein n=1 Tax=Tortispora caseinolytica NRRL Y-17796 TaxID=767744 RepID=A0A1E4TIG3_9ASCO|nr:hypothetical protein CANCADRAFT_72 [Tortispora caseinolytica NRRL Y-17796]